MIENAIIDKNARIGSNCVLVNKAGVQEVCTLTSFWLLKHSRAG